MAYKTYKVTLLVDHNVVRHEMYSSKLRCFLIGLIWKYMPDLTFSNRNYFIVNPQLDNS